MASAYLSDLFIQHKIQKKLPLDSLWPASTSGILFVGGKIQIFCIISETPHFNIILVNLISP